MKKFSCVFSTGEIVEWEAPGLTAYYWDLLRRRLMEWWDGQASLALVREVYEQQLPYSHQVCEIRLMRLRKWEPVGGHIIRKIYYGRMRRDIWTE